MRVIVCGGRKYRDRLRVVEQLDAILHSQPHDTLTIIQGGASGADEFARDWCFRTSTPYINYPANWDRDGRAAGPIRNQRMLDHGQPDLVIVFPGGAGTADMVARAKRAGVQLIEVPA